MRLTLGMAILAAALAGCCVHTGNTGPQSYDSNAIKVGSSTKDDVIAAFGQPDRKEALDGGGEELVYESTRKADLSLFLLLSARIESAGTWRIHIDENGIVRRVVWESGPAEQKDDGQGIGLNEGLRGAATPGNNPAPPEAHQPAPEKGQPTSDVSDAYSLTIGVTDGGMAQAQDGLPGRTFRVSVVIEKNGCTVPMVAVTVFSEQAGSVCLSERSRAFMFGDGALCEVDVFKDAVLVTVCCREKDASMVTLDVSAIAIEGYQKVGWLDEVDIELLLGGTTKLELAH